jgi:arsenical-resistance protein 2
MLCQELPTSHPSTSCRPINLSPSHHPLPGTGHHNFIAFNMSAEKPWHASFPAPTMTAEVMPQRRAFMILSMKIASMLIIDVRRTDYEGGSIRGSINIPAQGFWWNRGMLYELAYKADMEWVVFTCGSSNGRGPRCAGWFLEYVRNVAEDQNMQVMVLEGGVKGWVKAGPQYIQFMDGFRQEHWDELFAQEDGEKNAAAATIDAGAKGTEQRTDDKSADQAG